MNLVSVNDFYNEYIVNIIGGGGGGSIVGNGSDSVFETVGAIYELKGLRGMRHLNFVNFENLIYMKLYSLLILTKTSFMSRCILSCKQNKSAVYSTLYHIFPRLRGWDQSIRL